jgi:DNA polymerase III delta prime subunit
MSSIDTAFWCERVRKCFSMFSKDPNTLQHMLLFGPPGSGKTTSASWLVNKIWGNKKSLMCISMNAADERSLESIRQKVFPFLRVDWRTELEHAPRFLILDECETLTEAAQLSLQSILNYDPKDICVILICNSQSRIHSKLRQRMIKIRYDPPNCNSRVTDIFTAITRGDLRQPSHKKEIEQRLWKYLHAHPSQLIHIIRDETIDYHTILSEILLLADIFTILDKEIIIKINTLFPFISDNTILHYEIEQHIVTIILLFKQKFETKIVNISNKQVSHEFELQ